MKCLKYREEVNDFDKKLIKAYIGPNADKMYNEILNNKINIWGGLFGDIYFAYRKLYLLGIVLFTLLVIGSYFAEISTFNVAVKVVANVIILGLLIICSLGFPSIYKNNITKKLRRIKEENPNATEEELLMIAKQKGGTSIVGLVGVALINIVLAFVIIIILELIFKY